MQTLNPRDQRFPALHFLKFSEDKKSLENLNIEWKFRELILYIQRFFFISS